MQTKPCTGCLTDTFASGNAYLLVGPPGWYTLERVYTDDDVVITVLQVLQTTAKAYKLTNALPYGLAYIDVVQGYSVYLFVGVTPDLYARDCETYPLCPPRNGFVTVCGAGCPSLLPAFCYPCPDDNVGVQCRGPCDMHIVGLNVGPAAAPYRQVLLTVQQPIVIPPGNPPVIVRLTTRPCAAITPANAQLDTALSFATTFGGLAYVLLSQTAPNTVTVTAYSMLTGAQILANLPTCTSPLPTLTDCCVVSLYNVCTKFDAGQALPPAVQCISQVVFDNCVTTCFSGCPALQVSSSGGACCGHVGLLPAPLVVCSETELCTALENPANYVPCGALNRPLITLVPCPGPAPAPAPAPPPGAPSDAVRVTRDSFAVPPYRLLRVSKNGVVMHFDQPLTPAQWLTVSVSPGAARAVRVHTDEILHAGVHELVPGSGGVTGEISDSLHQVAYVCVGDSSDSNVSRVVHVRTVDAALVPKYLASITDVCSENV